MHYRSWKRSRKNPFSSCTAGDQQHESLGTARHQGRGECQTHISFLSHTRRENFLKGFCVCVGLDSLKTLLNDTRGVKRNLKLL